MGRGVGLEDPSSPMILFYKPISEEKKPKEPIEFKQANNCIKFCFPKSLFWMFFQKLSHVEVESVKQKSTDHAEPLGQTAVSVLAYPEMYSSGCSTGNSLSFNN